MLELISFIDFDGYIDNRVVLKQIENQLDFLDDEYKRQLVSDICSIVLSYVKFKTIKTKADSVHSDTFANVVKKLNYAYINRNVLGFMSELCKALDNPDYYSSTVVPAYYFLTNVKTTIQDIVETIYNSSNKERIIELIMSKLT